MDNSLVSDLTHNVVIAIPIQRSSMELTELTKLPPDGRPYRFPYTGPYTGEPDTYEIAFWKEHHDLWGDNSLTIYKTCPACGSDKAVWLRNQWAVCFECLIAFDAFECYVDIVDTDCPEPEDG